MLVTYYFYLKSTKITKSSLTYLEKNVQLYYNDYFRGTKKELLDVILPLVIECGDDYDDEESGIYHQLERNVLQIVISL